MPDFVVGLHIATGSGQTLWIERASKPVLNEEFAAKIGAKLIRDDDIFNAAVVSFGTFGIIAAVAVETAPIYQLEFPPIADIHHDDLKAKLSGFADAPSGGPLPLRVHLRSPRPQADGHGGERAEGGLRARGRDAEASLDSPRQERLRARHQHPRVSRVCSASWSRPASSRAFSSSSTARSPCWTASAARPGQIYTSSIYYLEGYIESAYAVSVRDAPATIDISSEVAREMRLPSINQVRLCRASQATLGFTQHEPITAVFEFGMIHDKRFAEFERRLDEAFRKAGIRYTMHWSKNSGIDPDKLDYMYGAAKIASWKAARQAVFGDDATLMGMFETDAMVRPGWPRAASDADASRAARIRRDALRDQQAVAGLRVTLDAEQCAGARLGQFRHDRIQVGVVEDLPGVALAVLRREQLAGAFPDAEPVVLAVLELAQLRGRRELGMVLDSRCRRRRVPPAAAWSWPTRTAARVRRGAGARPARAARRPPAGCGGTPRG